MIDRVEIKCFDDRITKHLTAEFFENLYGIAENIDNGNGYTFKLHNPKTSISNHLRITCPHVNNQGDYVTTFKIQNSLRKWWFGGKSVKDFSKQDFEAAINYLFDILEVSKRKRKYFLISEIEVGMNVFVKLSCPEILNRINGFKSRSYVCNTFGHNGIVYETKTYKNYLKIYDKVEEISKNFKTSKVLYKDESQFLKDYADKNIPRVEFTIDSPSQIKKRLGFNNLEDGIKHFENLYKYFWNEIRHIQFSNDFDDIPDIDFTGKNDTEFLNFLAFVGKVKLGKEYVTRKSKQLKYRTIGKKLKKLSESVPQNPCLYGKYAFLKDIRNQMLLSMYKSDCLHLVKELSLKKLDV